MTGSASLLSSSAWFFWLVLPPLTSRSVLLEGRRVGRSPWNSHPETRLRRTTMCVASVALAIERSAFFSRRFDFLTKRRRDRGRQDKNETKTRREEMIRWVKGAPALAADPPGSSGHAALFLHRFLDVVVNRFLKDSGILLDSMFNNFCAFCIIFPIMIWNRFLIQF